MEAIAKFFGALIGVAAGAAMVSWLILPTVVLFIAMTIGNALQQFWPLVIVIACCAVATALLVHSIQRASEQVSVVFVVPLLAAMISLLVVWQWGEFMACSLAVTVAAILYGAGAAMCRVEPVCRTAPIASIQVMWLAPLTMIPYTFDYIGPGYAVAPVVAMLVGAMGTIWAANSL